MQAKIMKTIEERWRNLQRKPSRLPSILNNLRKLGMERDVFHNKIEQMSMGQRKKVELAKSLSQPAELYTWDEPLNYLDVFNQEQLEQLILNVKPAMLLVEHDQTFLDKVSTEIISLERI